MLDQLARYRVGISTVFLVLVAFVNSPKPTLWFIGLLVACSGEAFRTWASGHIIKNEQLSQKGPYSIVRNPLYVGSFFMGLGFVLMNGMLGFILFYPFLFVTIFIKKIEQEEKVLIDHFGDTALDYYGRVPRLVPNLSLYQKSEDKWNMQQMLFVHKEWFNWILVAAMTWWFHQALLSSMA